MAQFGRPSADTYIGNYKDEGDGTTDIYTHIDETSYSDADYIKSPGNPSSGEVYVTKLSAVEDPMSSSGHTVRYRYRKDSAGGGTVEIKVQLRYGYVNEGTPGTQIKEWIHSDVGNTWTDGGGTLDPGEADSIPTDDYDDLYLRFISTQT